MKGSVTIGACGYSPGPKIVKRMKKNVDSETSLFISDISRLDAFLMPDVKHMVSKLSFKRNTEQIQ